MPFADQPLLLALAAFAIGIAVGRVWVALRSGRERSSGVRDAGRAHYFAGLDFLASRQIDRAVEELTKAAKANPDAPEITLILGNLLREKGQLERAIHIHQSILERPGLSEFERIHTLLSLGLDFKRAGFRNRALETFNEVIALEPGNAYALYLLMKIHEEDQDWERALALQQQISTVTGSQHTTVLAFLHDQIGQAAQRSGESRHAERQFETAIRTDRKLPPPYLNLGDLLMDQGRTEEATERWLSLLEVRPDKAHLAFERLEQAAESSGQRERMKSIYNKVIERSENDWRARVALARLFLAEGATADAIPLLLDAAERNPHALVVHREWLKLIHAENGRVDLIEKYLDTFSRAVFFWDAHRCIKCHYRANGILWRCPHCQEWDSFVEERVDVTTEQVSASI